MADYTTPITATFELQRRTLAQSQRAFKGGLEFQREMTSAAIDSLDVHERSQRQAVELLQDSVHRMLDAYEGLPGAAGTTDQVRETVDDQYDELLAVHEETFDTIENELGQGLDAYDELTSEYVETLDEQLDMLLDAHEEVEQQSITATEQVGEQVDQLQKQVEEVQKQIQQVSEQTADSVGA